jgi:hypothetical protein
MDIVERLRDSAFRDPTMEAIHIKDIRWQAADEIERLREALKKILNLETYYGPYDTLEIARAALKEGSDG